MTTLLKAGLMALGAACVLLLAGAFPLLGAPEVYRSGAVLLLGAISVLLCLWGGWRLASGLRGQLVFGLVFLFFTITGLNMLFLYGAKALEYAAIGGAMWAGFVGMGCVALTGVVFMAVFGFLCYRVMNKRILWLAGAHWAVALLGIGAFVDAAYEVRVPVTLPADGKTELTELLLDDGCRLPLGFRLRVDGFTVQHYDDATYTIYSFENGRPGAAQPVERRGDTLHLGAESWPVSSLKSAPGMPHPFLMLPGTPTRVLMQQPGTVRDYCARLVAFTDHRGRPETHTAELRVNSPFACKDWRFSLSSYREQNGQVEVLMQARRAPGRFASLCGMVGIIICTAVWCWWRKEEVA